MGYSRDSGLSSGKAVNYSPDECYDPVGGTQRQPTVHSRHAMTGADRVQANP